jgi:hypothetical protein
MTIRVNSLIFCIAQYDAWCKHSGNHATGRRGHVDWNAELIWKMRAELEYQWDLVEDEVPTVCSDFSSKTTSALENLRAAVSSKSHIYIT